MTLPRAPNAWRLSGIVASNHDDNNSRHAALPNGGLLIFLRLNQLRVHLTTREGVFPEDAAWTVKLPREPEDRALMDIEDLDGDGRSDLAYFNPEGTGFVATIVRSR